MAIFGGMAVGSDLWWGTGYRALFWAFHFPSTELPIFISSNVETITVQLLVVHSLNASLVVTAFP